MCLCVCGGGGVFPAKTGDFFSIFFVGLHDVLCCEHCVLWQGNAAD